MTKAIKIRNLTIGGGAPISIQTMSNADPHSFEACYAQLCAFEAAGADLVRFSLPDREAVRVMARLREVSNIPLVADIHFDYRLAIAAAEIGVDKIRINPGNIGSSDRVKAVAKACRKAGTPIRIGVNSGSLEKELLSKYGSPTPEALVESGLKQARMLEAFDFDQILISIKTSRVPDMIAACRMMARCSSYPLHLGVTEAGGGEMALVKGSIGIGTLLSEGIGDTLRVSLSEDPIKEIDAGRMILKALGLCGGVDIISCPTCGRTQVDVMELSRQLSQKYASVRLPGNRRIAAAVMGCVVNGPGEAGEADVGLAGGKDEWLYFEQGKVVEKIPANAAFNRITAAIDRLIAQTKD